jgi:hypothetical protein
MKKKPLTMLGMAVAVAGLALAASPVAAGASPTDHDHGGYHQSGYNNQRGENQGGDNQGGDNQGGDHHEGGPATADLSLVHGVPGLAVDIYVVKNFSSYKELSDVTFPTAVDLATALPGWVTAGSYVIDVVPTGTSPFKPLLITQLYLGAGQSKTVAAYVTADGAGNPGSATLGVFTNDVSSTGGQARVTVRHLAVAPTVGVYANGSVAITPSFSNGQSASAIVPAGSYDVTITAPNTPGTVYKDLGSVPVGANTNTLAFAIGTFPSTFTVVALAVPTA